MGVSGFLFLMAMAGLEKLLLTDSTEALWSPHLWRDAWGWELRSFLFSYPSQVFIQWLVRDWRIFLEPCWEHLMEVLELRVEYSCTVTLAMINFMCRLFLPAICSVEAKLLFMLRKMCWNVINLSENSVCSCKTTATVQDHYKSVPIWTLNMSFIRIFSTFMIQSNRFVFCWPCEEAKVMLMWLLTVSDMALVSPSRNFHVNIPYFEGITLLFPWILLKILSLISLPSIFCLFHNIYGHKRSPPLLHLQKDPFPHPMDVLGGFHWEPEPSPSLGCDTSPSGTEGSPALSPSLPQQLEQQMLQGKLWG